MNQIKKRLHIIKLAISITDIECVDYQVPKLRQFKTDIKLQKILDLLQNKNYAQAQELITEYIATPIEEIRSNSFTDTHSVPLSENSQEEIRKIEDIEAFLGDDTPPVKSYDNDIDFDALLSLDANDILQNNIDIDLSESHTDHFFDQDKPSDLKTKQQEKSFFGTNEEDSCSSLFGDKTSIHENTLERNPKEYPPIPYIYDKFANTKREYPPVEQSNNEALSVTLMLKKIASEPYLEEDIEKKIDFVTELIEDDAKAEAAELLLVCACTPSPYAQLMLARTLFKGEILVSNIEESFRILFHLANNENYPEAMCDLAQFYEHGIGVKQDRQKAESLYKEAAHMGIERATRHLKRLDKKKGGFLSRIFNRSSHTTKV